MIRLANLIWFPHFHRTIKLRAENCKQGTDQGKNFKTLIPKSDLGKLPKLDEPNQEVQLDFAGPIPNESNKDTYILVAVDRFSRFLSAVVHPNCDATTAINFLQKYCEFHGIPRSLRCDQAQAFKSKIFEIYCKNKNIKLIFSPTNDHRATGMVERLIQTLKRRLASMISDPIWNNTTIAEKISAIIESIRLIPNRVTKITAFEAHFGRPPNTEISNIVTKPKKNNLTYNKIKYFYLDKKLLQHAALTPSDIWDQDANSETNLNIQYQQRQESPGTGSESESASENTPLGNFAHRGTIIPSKITFQMGDKTTTINQTRKNLARKTIRRRVPEPRGTLKPLWSIIPDGTITNYTPHTITLDTHNRKNTVIRNNDKAISKESVDTTQKTNLVTIPEEPKLRLINFVACKTVGEYNRNKKKIEKFCLEEKRKRKADELAKEPGQIPPAPRAKAPMLDMPGPSKAPTAQSTPVDIPGPSRAPSTRSISPIKQMPRKLPYRIPTKSATKNNPRRQTKQATAQKKLTKAKLAALKQSQAFATKQRTNLKLNQIKSPTVRKFKVKAKTPYKKDHIIVTSLSPSDFMNSPTPQSNPTITTISKSPNSANPRKRSADNTVRKLHVENMLTNLPITPTNEIVDLIESSDNPTHREISIQPPATDFGQSCIILLSDSQDSITSFHTAAPSIAPP